MGKLNQFEHGSRINEILAQERVTYKQLEGLLAGNSDFLLPENPILNSKGRLVTADFPYLEKAKSGILKGLKGMVLDYEKKEGLSREKAVQRGLNSLNYQDRISLENGINILIFRGELYQELTGIMDDMTQQYMSAGKINTLLDKVGHDKDKRVSNDLSPDAFIFLCDSYNGDVTPGLIEQKMDSLYRFANVFSELTLNDKQVEEFGHDFNAVKGVLVKMNDSVRNMMIRKGLGPSDAVYFNNFIKRFENPNPTDQTAVILDNIGDPACKAEGLLYTSLSGKTPGYWGRIMPGPITITPDSVKRN